MGELPVDWKDCPADSEDGPGGSGRVGDGELLFDYTGSAPECPYFFNSKPEIVRSLASALPDARVRTVPGSGHSIYFENPDVFNQLVRDFMLDIGYAR